MTFLDSLLAQTRKPTKSISVRIPEATVDALDKMLAHCGIRRSEFLEAAVHDAIEELTRRINDNATPTGAEGGE